MDIRLTHPHTHAGVDYQPGAILTVSEPVGAWLVKNAGGVIHDKSPDVITLSAAPKRHRKHRHHTTEETHHAD